MRWPQLWGQEDARGIVGNRVGFSAAFRVLCLVCSNTDLVTTPVVESAGTGFLKQLCCCRDSNVITRFPLEFPQRAFFFHKIGNQMVYCTTHETWSSPNDMAFEVLPPLSQ